jgi:precorrin-6x reductase
VILLLGGTSDTDPIAQALVSRGQEVRVSTVTDYPLTLTSHPMRYFIYREMSSSAVRPAQELGNETGGENQTGCGLSSFH